MQTLKNGKYQYNFKDLLGNGSFGSVFKCVNTETKEVHALKIIDKKKLNHYGDYLNIALKREIET